MVKKQTYKYGLLARVQPPAVNINFIFFVSDIFWVKFILFFFAKGFMSIAFIALYLYTSELFPTSCRQRICSFCSTCGYIGAIAALQVPFLVSKKNDPTTLKGRPLTPMLKNRTTYIFLRNAANIFFIFFLMLVGGRKETTKSG